jgi:ribonuclease P protein component
VTESTDNSNVRNTFRKTERLSSRKEIERLFASGNSISAHPLKLMLIKRDGLPDIPVQTMFVVPKRSFRKAHDRNLLRRRMKESFRLQKNILYKHMKEKKQCLSMAILYTGKTETDFATISKAVEELLVKLRNRF